MPRDKITRCARAIDRLKLLSKCRPVTQLADIAGSSAWQDGANTYPSEHDKPGDDDYSDYAASIRKEIHGYFVH